MNKIFLLVIGVFSLMSCKEEKEESKPVEKEIKNNFTLTVNAVVEKDDVFQLFYNEDDSSVFPDEQSLLVTFKGSPNAQNIVFELPEHVTPKKFRFDVGSNSTQKVIKINNLNIKYLEKNFDIKKAEFKDYFYPINQLELDSTSLDYKVVYKQGDPFDPILLGTDKMEKLTKTFFN